MADEERKPEFSEKGITLAQTMSPFTQAQNGGRTGWWEGEQGEVRLKVLEQAFLMGHSDSEACYLAGISKQSLYNYINQHNPSFGNRKEELKQNLTIVARRVVAKKVTTDPEMAWKYLSRKLPNEFGEPNVIQNNVVLGDVNTNIFDKDFLEFPNEVVEEKNETIG